MVVSLSRFFKRAGNSIGKIFWILTFHKLHFFFKFCPLCQTPKPLWIWPPLRPIFLPTWWKLYFAIIPLEKILWQSSSSNIKLLPLLFAVFGQKFLQKLSWVFVFLSINHAGFVHDITQKQQEQLVCIVKLGTVF